MLFHKFSNGKNFTSVAYQCNCMEIDLSDRTNNVLVIKYFNLLLVFFPLKMFGSLIRSQKFIHIVTQYYFTLKIVHIKLEVHLIVFKN